MELPSDLQSTNSNCKSHTDCMVALYEQPKQILKLFTIISFTLKYCTLLPDDNLIICNNILSKPCTRMKAS